MSGAIPGNVHDTGQPLPVKNNIKSRVKLSSTKTNFQPKNNNAICKKNLNEHLVLKPEDIVNNICQTIKKTADACKLPTRSLYLLCQRLYKDALEAHLFAKQKKYQAKYTSSGDQIDIKQTIKKAKKYKNELNSLRDTLYSGNVIDICLNLAPLFIDAARSGHLNSAFIENLYNQIEQMVPSDSQVPGYLRILQISFARFLHPETLQAFINYINTYLQQIQAAQDRAAQNEIEEKLLLFVYNVLVPPYQRPYSGSCFLSAILINMWHNNPVKLMNLIKCVINLNGTIDLTFMHGKGAFDPRDFKKRCDKRDAIYEILSAVLASTDEYEQISVVIDKETQDNPLKYQTELILKERKIPDQIAAYIADTITDKVFYENGRRIPLCAHKKYNEKTIDVMHNIAHELTKAMSRVGYKNPDDATLNLMAIDILSNVHARGGIPENIMKNLSKKPRPPRVETIEYKT
ncbi:MAG: hypothetical protein K2L13_02065, partial [Opitutales bacterium]|nr:hypothetical protein [Opitutales bacterium]